MANGEPVPAEDAEGIEPCVSTPDELAIDDDGVGVPDATMDLGVVAKGEACVVAGQGADVMDPGARAFVAVDDGATTCIDQSGDRRRELSGVGVAAVVGSRLNRETHHRALSASPHIGQRASDPENGGGGCCQSGFRVEPCISGGPEENLDCAA